MHFYVNGGFVNVAGDGYYHQNDLDCDVFVVFNYLISSMCGISEIKHDVIFIAFFFETIEIL